MSKYIFLIYLLLLKINLSVQNCIKGEKHCSKCNYITKRCVKCDIDIYTPDQYGGCEPSKKCVIGKNYCNECLDNLNKCNVCENGYFPDENGGCSYTDNCLISYKGECIQCKTDYILIGKNSKINNNLLICKSLLSEDLKNCEEIDISTGFCKKCKNGFYLNEGDNHCSETENCYESLFGFCTKCIRNYYLNKKEEKCLKQEETFLHCQQTIDGKNCDICDANFFLSEDGKCSLSNYCSKVGNSNLCLECISGFHFSEYNSICSSTENCYLSDSELGLCLSCLKNYCLDYKDGQCKSNQEDNILKYCRTADGFCFDCYYPYFLGEDLKCTPSKNCSESYNGICQICSDNNYLGLDNKCSTIENCSYLDDYYFCYQCKEKYYYDAKESKCSLEKEGFINCRKSHYTGEKCEKCRDGFYLNKTDNLCYSYKEYDNFYKCEETDSTGEFCNLCVKDYYLGIKYKRCTKIKGCEISLDQIKYDECDEFHVLLANKGICEINNKITDEDKKYYYKCNKTNEEGSVCELCIDGFSLNKNGLCTDDKHCLEEKEGICVTCQNKDNNINYCLNSVLGCVETSSVNCLECNDMFDFNKCSKCLEGYELNDNNECVEKGY